MKRKVGWIILFLCEASCVGRITKMLATSIAVPLRSDGLYGTNSLLLSPFARAVCVEAQGKGGGHLLTSAHDAKCISSSVRD